MAATKSFALANIDNALVDLYTVPASKSAIVIGVFVHNKTASAADIEVVLVKATGSVTVFIAQTTLQAKQTLFPIGDPFRLGLEAADKIQVRATSGSNILDAGGSAIEEDV